MLCDTCKQTEATVFLTQISHGRMTKTSLCATCAAPLLEAPRFSGKLMESFGPGRDYFAEIAEQYPRFTKEAFWFVRDGVDHACASRVPTSRHVTANELLESLRILALERFGHDARQQLATWGITRCEDFGEIVFALIEKGIFGRREEDRKEDFAGGYDFSSAFPIS